MRVSIVSPYPTVRAGLAALAREQPGWVVVSVRSPEAFTGQSAAAPADQPSGATGVDVLLIDLEHTPDAETLANWVAAMRPHAGVVALGAGGLTGARGQPDSETLRMVSELAREMEAQGLAFGALLRDADASEIVNAVSAVGAGLLALDRRLGRSLFAPDRRPNMPTPASALADEETLTAREREVLQLLAQGFPNKIIAQRLKISEHTAKFHVSSIMTKLGAASRTEAVTLAARRGLLIL
ncbi:MAG TPA: response regulator transcription factor [Ktedonobacterales bacterium]|nr:response regulator transcription factor [Ktedonobacterales bacterium]